MTPGLASNAARRGSPPPVNLEVWAASEGSVGTWAALALLLGMPLMVGLVTRDAALGMGAGALMIIAGWRFFVPAVYEIDALGISERVLWRQRRILWRAVAGIEIGRRGVLVIPDVRCCPRLRGLYLPWGTQREAVMALFAYHLDKLVDRTQDSQFDLSPPREPASTEAAATKPPPPASQETDLP
jgi:hypothetical protein